MIAASQSSSSSGRTATGTVARATAHGTERFDRIFYMSQLTMYGAGDVTVLPSMHAHRTVSERSASPNSTKPSLPIYPAQAPGTRHSSSRVPASPPVPVRRRSQLAGPSSGSESDGNKCTRAPRRARGRARARGRPFEDRRRTGAAQRARPPSASRRPGDRADRAPGPPRSCPDADADASRSHRTRWPGVTRCHVILSYLNHD